MRIVILEPFFTGSHQRWAKELQQHSQHNITILSLAGRHWKWRMHGGAVSLAQQASALEQWPDLWLATDMLDVATFKALLPAGARDIPFALYMHENQLTYPWSPTDADVPQQRDRHYSWINYTSALVADRIFFNSHYHHKSFLDALPTFLRAFPDQQNIATIDSIIAKSEVLHLGMDLAKLSTKGKRHDPHIPIQKADDGSPILLWNHRWEYDKNPGDFFELCYELDKTALPYQLVVLGEGYGKVPIYFTEAKERLSHRILHWGYTKEAAHYAYWLNRADILPVTSKQDFFGGSVVEAMYCGAIPLLPNRLAYPEHIPDSLQAALLYDNQTSLYEKVAALLHPTLVLDSDLLKKHVARYDWTKLRREYDERFGVLIGLP